MTKRSKTTENKKKTGFALNPEGINRNGRPRLGEDLTSLMREYLSTTEPGHVKTRKQEFIEKVAKLGYDGDMNAIKLIWNYLEGMPVQRNELSGIAGQPIEISTKLSSRQKQELSRKVADAFKEIYGELPEGE